MMLALAGIVVVALGALTFVLVQGPGIGFVPGAARGARGGQ